MGQVTSTDYPQCISTRVDGDSPHLIWQSLQGLISQQAAEVRVQNWFVTPQQEEPFPIRYEVLFKSPQLTMTVSPTSQVERTYRSANTFDVSMPFDAANLDVAKELMSQFLLRLEETRRDACSSSGTFLANSKRLTWHTLEIGKMNIPAFHKVREQVFKDWRLITTGDPRQGELRVERLKDYQGELKSVCTNARYYLRDQNRRLILDLHNDGHIHLAGEGFAEGELESIVEAIDEQLKTLFGSISRAVTAKGESVVLDAPVSWDDLFLDQATTELLQSEVANFFDNRELFKKMSIPHRRGLLLYGIPGTGKTMFGKLLVSTIENCLFLWITASDVDNPSAVSQIFSLARGAKRTILFFEDLDMYASQRSHYGTTSTLGELMVQMDGMHSNEGIMVIATTNDLAAIEPALKDRPSRFDRVVEFKAPPEEVRLKFLRRLLGTFGVPDVALERLAGECEGMSGAQLKELAIIAKSCAAQRGSSQVESGDLKTAVGQAKRFKAVPTGFGGKSIEAEPRDLEDYF